MGISFVQKIDPGTNSFATGTTGSLTFGANTSAHNLIVVGTNYANDPPTISDGVNTYHHIIDDGGFFTIGLWYAWNIAGGATTISFTYGSSQSNHFAWANEYSGVQFSADPLDQSDVNKTATSSSVNASSNPLTTSVNGELWVSFANENDQLSAVSPFTQRSSFLAYGGTITQIMVEDWIQSTAGTATAPWLLSFSPSEYSIVTATFKPAPSGFQPPGQIISAAGW